MLEILYILFMKIVSQNERKGCKQEKILDYFCFSVGLQMSSTQLYSSSACCILVVEGS